MTTRVELIGEVIGKPELVIAEGKPGCLIRVEPLNSIGSYGCYNVVVLRNRRVWLYRVGTIIEATGVLRGNVLWADSCKKYYGKG